MAIATNSGHVSRAIDLYKKAGKYFSVGKTSAWTDETTPPDPSADTYKIDELVALKKVDNVQLVVPDNENGTIVYRDSKWRIVQETLTTTVGTGGVSEGSQDVPLTSLAGITVGCRLRIGGEYEGKVTAMDASSNTVTLDTSATGTIAEGSNVLGGAYIEGAKYVYVSCTLSYDTFPIVTYREVGFHTEVQPDTTDILRAAEYATSEADEFTSLGNLEIIDNRPPTTRTQDQSESISIIIEL